MNPNARSLLLIVFAALFLSGCQWLKKDKTDGTPPALMKYVSAYTSGVVSKESSVHVRFMEPVPFEVNPSLPVKNEYFEIHPEWLGTVYWKDNQTLEFRPDKPFKSGQQYMVTFNLSSVLEVPKTIKTFEFQFTTIQQGINMQILGYEPYNTDDLTKNRISGLLQTADAIDVDNLQHVVAASQQGNVLPVRWETTGHDLQFKCIIDSVVRQEVSGEVKITWNGKALDAGDKGNKVVDIPPLSEFSIQDVRVVHLPAQCIEIRFSDPLAGQNLDGLIELENQSNLSFTIDKNLIRACTDVRQSGKLALTLHAGIRNIMGYKLEKSIAMEVDFEARKPAVRGVSQGTIMPRSSKLLFPFEAVNLKAVDVKVIRIFENNIAQFLQSNNLGGSSRLKQVGRLVAKEKIDLETPNPLDLSAWNTFSIDLSKIINVEPGAIYRVEIGFRPQYAIFPCDEPISIHSETISQQKIDEELAQEQAQYWDVWNNHYRNSYNYYYGYWNDQDNPCKPAYYGDHNFYAQNVLASDLGITAKKTTTGKVHAYVTNLVTAQPINNVEVRVLNYQQQVLGRAKTNTDGMAEINYGGSMPFLLVADDGKQKGYLKLNEGASLSLSAFDVSGNQMKSGLKAFIYGERGVWRPGDTLYLTMILNNTENQLPPNQAVTFTLHNPRGQMIDKQVNLKGKNGFYHFKTSTSADAITGFYQASFRIGGITFNKELRIETIKPNRLKIAFDAPEKIFRNTFEGHVQVNWLHGAPAGSLPLEVDYHLREYPGYFKGYNGYTFTDATRAHTTERRRLFEGQTNTSGKAAFFGNLLPPQPLSGVMLSTFVVKASERGGSYTLQQYERPFLPYRGYVGLKMPQNGDRQNLETGKTHTVSLITLDADGNPRAQIKLEISLYKLEWRWWWDASGDNLANYENSSFSTLVEQKTVNTNADGKGTFQFSISDELWGRYLIRVYDAATGHSSAKVFYADWPGWRSRDFKDNPDAAAMYIFKSDKTQYQPGETANIMLPASGGARALISIENGSKVIKAFWVNKVQNDTTVSFEITPNMVPNIYVFATIIQPHNQTKHDMPIRQYGVIPVMVTDPETNLNPVIKQPAVLKPESKFTVTVSEKQGREMTYTLAIVDEGLLSLTGFDTPAPHGYFFAREALGVQTWDMYNQVLGAYGGELKGIFSIGGGMGKTPGAMGSSDNRFTPVVMFAGPYQLESNATMKHTFTMPNYIGSVKTMVVAGNGKAFGSNQAISKVAQPLMVLASAPRKLTPGDEFKLPVNVFALQKNYNTQVVVEIKTNGLVKVVGGNRKQIVFKSEGERMVYFDMETMDKTGEAQIEVLIGDGNNTARYHRKIEVRSPHLPETNIIEHTIQPGQQWSKEFPLPGIAGTNSGALEVSVVPPLNLEHRLKYLINYPHGCIEQVTSSVFPQLYLHKLMETDKQARLVVEKNIKEGISRLISYISQDGGFSYWPGNYAYDDWATSYAGHFLLEAKKMGYDVPDGMIEQWSNFQKNKADKWNPMYDKEGFLQAYRLYTLALAGEYKMGAMNRLRQSQDLVAQSKWVLSATYALAGQLDVARELMAGVYDYQPSTSSIAQTYGSRWRDYALLLETNRLLNNETEQIKLAGKLAGTLNSEEWLSTQTTAFCLWAMSKYLIGKDEAGQIAFDYKINTGKVTSSRTKLPFAQVEIPMKNTAHSAVYVKNTGNQSMHTRLIFTPVNWCRWRFFDSI